jgi:peptide/nickel transport system substrate-binding protein
VTGTRVLFVGLDVVQDSPLKDVRVRQALNYAVDKKTITSRLIGLASEETTTLLTSSDFGFTPELNPIPTIQESPSASGGCRVSERIQHQAGRDHRTLYQRQRRGAGYRGLSGQVGVKVELNILEFGAFNGALFSHKTSPMYFVGWGNRCSTPHTSSISSPRRAAS